MDHHRSKTSNRRSRPPTRSGAHNTDSLPESLTHENDSKSGLAVPQREPRSARGDPLYPFVALVKTFNEFLFELDAEQVTGTGCWEHDVRTHQRIWSSQLFRIYGFDPKNGVPSEETMFAMIHPDDRERIRGILCSALEHSSPFESEGRYNLPDGRQRIIFVRGITLPDDSGKTARLVAVVQDVTEIRRAQAQAQERESLLAQAEQLASLGSWEFDVTQQSFTWSAQMYRMLGLPPDGQPVPLAQACALFHPDDRAGVTQEVGALIKYARPLENEVRFVLPDAQVRVVHSRAVPITNDSGDVVRIAGTSQDVTAQKSAQDRVRKSESLLALAEEIAKLGSWEMDMAHSTITCSTEFFRMLGLDPLIGAVPVEDVWSLVRLEDIGAARQALQTAIATHTPFEHFSRYIMPDGSARVLHTRAVPIADSSGQITRIVGFNHDITEQKRVEDDLRRLSRQLLTLRSEEQRRLARELHETASQTLTALKMTLKQIEDLLPQHGNRARELAKSCRALTSDAIREVRTISSILHPPLMDEAGLTVGLGSYVRLFSERSGVGVNFAIPDDFQRLPKEVELTLFCVAQESLANVHRHSKARAVQISIDRSPTHVSLTVRDDGIGMALPSHSDRRNSLLGIGIAGMRERVNQLQGQFHIHSSPGKGTTIQVNLPLVVEERSE
jgi:PAS domain S-box-containing protein